MISTPSEATAPLSRRQAIKVLAVSTSALAMTAFLPGRWIKPVVHAGVLPAHAQSTACATLQVIDGDACSAYSIDCSGFTHTTRFVYTPTILTPWRSEVTACGRTVPSSVYYDPLRFPGEFFLLYNGSDTSQCIDTVVIITFKEGCSGVWSLI